MAAQYPHGRDPGNSLGRHYSDFQLIGLAKPLSRRPSISENLQNPVPIGEVRLAIVETPRLKRPALGLLREAIDGALLFLSSSSTMKGGAMRSQPAGRRQCDLLVRAANALEESRIPPAIRAEMRFLLKLLIAECRVADSARSVAVGDE